MELTAGRPLPNIVTNQFGKGIEDAKTGRPEEIL